MSLAPQHSQMPNHLLLAQFANQSNGGFGPTTPDAYLITFHHIQLKAAIVDLKSAATVGASIVADHTRLDAPANYWRLGFLIGDRTAPG